MRSEVKNLLMFIRSTFRRIIFIEIVVVVLVCTLIINLYLFYHLKSVSYPQSNLYITVGDLSICNNVILIKISVLNIIWWIFPQPVNQIILNERRNESTGITYAPVKHACRVGNYSTFVSDLLLQLREDLEDFYFNVSRSTVLRSRCLQFLSNVDFMKGNQVILVRFTIIYREVYL